MNKLIVVLSLFVIALALISCSEKNEILNVGTHPKAWNDTASPQFHGKAVVEGGNQQCASCHGTDFNGGTSGVGCYGSGCHSYYPHPTGFANMSSMEFHGQYLRSQLNWNVRDCQKCHGNTYAGGSSGVSCRECHTAAEGPEACNTCHGNELNFAPPQDLNNNVDRSALGVGAHQMHVANTMVTRTYNCSTCHPDLTGFDDPLHINQAPAEISFSSLATDNGRLSPVWNRTAGTCSEVYCHGNFQFGSSGNPITGKSDPVTWTAQNPNPAACDLCHALPPSGHFGQGQYNTPGSCAQCHGSVVNASGTIINTGLHINGQADFN